MFQTYLRLLVRKEKKISSKTISDHTVTDVSKLGSNSTSEKMKVITTPKSEESSPENGLAQKAIEDKNDKPKKSLNGGVKEEKDLGQKALEEKGHNEPTAVLQTSVKNVGDVKIGVSEDLNGGDKIISNNYQRRASLPANFNDQENELHNTPRLPSYMAPTESAKARLRGQGSPRFVTDSLDKNSLTRRHSLSSSFNSKSGSFSPRTEKLVSLSSRGVARTDKSLSSSRDGTDKLTQPQWRR